MATVSESRHSVTVGEDDDANNKNNDTEWEYEYHETETEVMSLRGAAHVGGPLSGAKKYLLEFLPITRPSTGSITKKEIR